MKFSVLTCILSTVLAGCVQKPSVRTEAPEPQLEIQGAICCIPEGELESVRGHALAGNVEAMLRMMRDRDLCHYDTQGAIPWARMASEAGSLEGRFWLAMFLFYQDADRSNDPEAIELMRDVASHDWEESQKWLDEMEREHAANQALQTTPMTRSEI